MSSEPLAVLKGTLDVLVLKALTWQPMHGFEITSWLEECSGHRLALEDAALYQALYRLEKRGLVAASWGVTEANRRARDYRITPAGRSSVVAQTAQWVRYAETMNDILLATPRGARSCFRSAPASAVCSGSIAGAATTRRASFATRWSCTSHCALNSSFATE